MMSDVALSPTASSKTERYIIRSVTAAYWTMVE
jgi:hypothetical protein